MQTADLRQQNRQFANTAGVSENSRAEGFEPAFMDTATGEISRSRFRNGQPAPLHILEGLPSHWATARDETGRITQVRDSVVAGFIREGEFYTREQAANH